MSEIKPQTSPFIWMLIICGLIAISTSYCGGNLAIASVETTSTSASVSAETVGKLPRVVKNLDEKGVGNER